MKKTLIAAVAGTLAVPFVALVVQAPPANACPPGFSVQNQSPLLGPQCAPNPNAQPQVPAYTPPPMTGPFAVCNQYELPSDRQVCADTIAGARR